MGDDLKSCINAGNRIAIAAACFSIYAYQELCEQLESCEELRFIFTSPTFIAEKTKSERREFYIPRLGREARMSLEGCYIHISERKSKGTENREMILRACFVISTSLDPLAVLVEHIAFIVHDMQYGVHIKHAAADVVVCGIDRCKADGHI